MEIEIRGKLSKEKFDELFNLLETEGEATRILSASHASIMKKVVYN